MTQLSAVLAKLRYERARLDKAISALENVNGRGPTKRRGLSAAARAKIAAAQRKRWAKWKRAKTAR